MGLKECLILAVLLSGLEPTNLNLNPVTGHMPSLTSQSLSFFISKMENVNTCLMGQ